MYNGYEVRYEEAGDVTSVPPFTDISGLLSELQARPPSSPLPLLGTRRSDLHLTNKGSNRTLIARLFMGLRTLEIRFHRGILEFVLPDFVPDVGDGLIRNLGGRGKYLSIGKGTNESSLIVGTSIPDHGADPKLGPHYLNPVEEMGRVGMLEGISETDREAMATRAREWRLEPRELFQVVPAFLDGSVVVKRAVTHDYNYATRQYDDAGVAVGLVQMALDAFLKLHLPLTTSLVPPDRAAPSVWEGFAE
jgi:hypothetical protein